MYFKTLLFLLCTSFLQAQSPYHLSPFKDYTATGVGVGLTAANYFLWTKQVKGLTTEQLNALDPFDIPAYDRWATNNYSVSIKKASDILLLGTVASPVFLLLDPDIRKDSYTTGVMYAETMLLTQLSTSIVKQVVLRPRPLAYNINAPLEKRMEQGARFSFFSGHVSLTASSTFFSASVYNAHHPDSRYKPLVWTAAAIVPAVMGYLRIKAGKHYLSDVITGYIIGAGIGLLVPALHRSNP